MSSWSFALGNKGAVVAGADAGAGMSIGKDGIGVNTTGGGGGA